MRESAGGDDVVSAAGKVTESMVEATERRGMQRKAVASDRGGEAVEVLCGEAGGPVGVGAVGGVLPGVEVQAVEGADRGEEQRGSEEFEAEVGAAGDGGDEDGGREEDAYGELFREAALVGEAGVDEEEPCDE